MVWVWEGSTRASFFFVSPCIALGGLLLGRLEYEMLLLVYNELVFQQDGLAFALGYCYLIEIKARKVDDQDGFALLLLGRTPQEFSVAVR